MLPSHVITRPVGPISGVGLFSGKPASIMISPDPGEPWINFVSPLPYPHPFAGVELRRVTYDTSWAGMPKGVPIRNTTLNASGPLARDEPVPEPPRFVVATVEHILGALAGLGIWIATISIDGPEVPIFDGSAKLFVDILLGQLAPAPSLRKPLVLQSPIEVRDGDASIIATPAADLSYTYNLDYGPNSPLKPHSATWRGSPADFTANIAPARTFSLRAEAEGAQKMGLFKHLSPRDMLVIGDDGQPIDNAWRMEGEPARHKLLDLIGDLALLGRPLIAKIVATKSGHRLTHEFCRAVLRAT
jgi:UDP-3-O-[3-hydroxymyristoyl] N-acetylglucosamine deacetylase